MEVEEHYLAAASTFDLDGTVHVQKGSMWDLDDWTEKSWLGK